MAVRKAELDLTKKLEEVLAQNYNLLQELGSGNLCVCVCVRMGVGDQNYVVSYII